MIEGKREQKMEYEGEWHRVRKIEAALDPRPPSFRVDERLQRNALDLDSGGYEITRK
jgi:hypothetical protein